MGDKLYDLLSRPLPDTRTFNAYNYIFLSTDEVKKNESRFYISGRMFVISPKQINNCGFWVHEFSELSIIGLIESEGLDWRRFIDWKKYGFRSTIVSHIISPHGLNNKRCLNPQLSKKSPEW